jgi:threonine aldolase
VLEIKNKSMEILISDTITKPTHEMLQFMFNAEVGDDVYKQDPTVELEDTIAQILGWKSRLYPSGTMANQTAIKLHTKSRRANLLDKYAHVYVLLNKVGSVF